MELWMSWLLVCPVVFPFDRFPVKRDIAVPAFPGISCSWVNVLPARVSAQGATVERYLEGEGCDLWDY